MVTETSDGETADSATIAGPGGLPGRNHLARAAPTLAAALLCLLLGIVSVHVLPSLPAYDEFSWLVWGREIAHQLIGPHEPFDLLGGPSWKPFPLIFTSIFGFFGSSAVAIWVAFVRAVGLFGLWLAYRCGARLVSGEWSFRWPWAATVAGTLSAAAVALTLGWFHFMYRATSEPLAVTMTLLWVERMLAMRRLQGLLAGMALAMIRPEAGVFVAVYGAWLLWREPGIWRRAVTVAGVALVPIAWVVPPWIANGDPLQASSRARAFQGNAGHEVATFVLQRAHTLVTAPVIALAGLAIILALWRRDRIVIGLAVASIAYVGVVEVMALRGWPGLPRFMLPAAAVVSVLAAVTVVRLASLAGGGVGSALIALALTAAAVPFCVSPAQRLVSEEHYAAVAARWDQDLQRAVHRAGRTRDVLPCRSSRAGVNHLVQPSLAWYLTVPLDHVWPLNAHPSSIRGPGVVFVAHGSSIVGVGPTRLRGGYVARQLLQVKMWHVLRITWGGNSAKNRCVGARAATHHPIRTGPWAARGRHAHSRAGAAGVSASARAGRHHRPAGRGERARPSRHSGGRHPGSRRHRRR